MSILTYVDARDGTFEKRKKACGNARHFLTDVGPLVAVGVHGRHDEDAGVVHQGSEPLGAPVLLAQQTREQEQHLPSNDLVAVDVAHILELWLAWTRREK